MAERPKILLLDDEQDLLDLYKEVLTNLPSNPEIHLANSGARALALLEAETFNLLISDLRMPKMDGLQVLSIVRRKFPDLRVVVMTSVTDEQYRSRAYALGVDMFWEKPSTPDEIKLFQECIASLTENKTKGGFRGVQSKSLVDLIQLECLSQNSSILKITNNAREGRIWVQDGNIIDAVTNDKTGHDAFKEIFSWRAGAFEILPADTSRERKIFENYQGLLLDNAQALDEAQNQETVIRARNAASSLADLIRSEELEYVIETGRDAVNTESYGAEQAEPLAAWARQVAESFATLGDHLHAGTLSQAFGIGFQGHLAVVPGSKRLLCMGLKRTLTAGEVQETIRRVKQKWDC